MAMRAIMAIMMLMLGQQAAVAGGSCSSRDGAQYCTCNFDKKCISNENDCKCILYGTVLPNPQPRDLGRSSPAPSSEPSPPPAIVAKPLPPPVTQRSPPAPIETETLPIPPIPAEPPPAVIASPPSVPPPAAAAPEKSATDDAKSNDKFTPADYVRLAEGAIIANDFDNAFFLIDNARLGLLNRAIANKKFDPASFAPIEKLATAKQFLVVKDSDHALDDLEDVLKIIDTSPATN